MREFGVNTIHRTGDLQIDVLTVEVKRAQNAAFEAASKAEQANAGVQRLESEIKRHRRRTLGSMAAALFMLVLVFCLLLARSY
jgi:hypothetical protein